MLPSLSKGFPMTLPEAMLCRVPIAGGETGGIPEIIHDGENGLLVPPREPVGLASAIQTVLSGGPRISGIVERGELTARTGFSWKANAERIIRLYQAACAS